MEQSETSQLDSFSDPQIPSSLKFVISNIKVIVPTPLSNNTYSAWKSQILKLFSANEENPNLSTNKKP
ncbi:hypothetical protein M5K25_017479 [Dendrobium thyrsiflorum]|uniref:Retrotransposon Copia-like N-terminal domain-containing protein n=1 Tax=Dendrobium thyrsiflorum TaxID=117978 RepID=A0ABD0UMH0_DENTH